MSLKQKYALGEPVPNNPHAVVSNVPTLEDVCAYEEKADYVVSAMKAGLSSLCTTCLGESID